MTTLTWSSDLCDCLFEIEPPFNAKKIIKKCAAHSSVSDKKLFETIVEADKKINLMPRLRGETDEDHQNRRWLAKDKAIKINKKMAKSK